MTQLAFIQNIGMPELLIILVIALLLFGRRLPDVGRSLGRGLVEFKKGVKGIQEEVDSVDKQVDDELKAEKTDTKSIENVEPAVPVTENEKVKEEA